MFTTRFGAPILWQDDADWKGVVGPEATLPHPTFVLTHRPRLSIEMQGGTVFHFLDATRLRRSTPLVRLLTGATSA